MKVIKLPQLTGAQLDSWLGLAEFAGLSTSLGTRPG